MPFLLRFEGLSDGQFGDAIILRQTGDTYVEGVIVLNKIVLPLLGNMTTWSKATTTLMTLNSCGKICIPVLTKRHGYDSCKHIWYSEGNYRVTTNMTRIMRMKVKDSD